MILKLISIALITAICSFILKNKQSDLVPLCVTAGGTMFITLCFDMFAESWDFLKVLIQGTNIQSSAIKIVLKMMGVGYLFDLTADTIKDLGFESLSKKIAIACKLIVLTMSFPLLNELYNILISLIENV